MPSTNEIPPPGHSVAVPITGASGALEALLAAPDAGEPRAVCLVCHPHPLYGGNLTNKVVHTLARAAQAQGFLTLRFNFRGVGASAGTYGGGDGEAEDAVAAAAWLRSRAPGLPLVIQGFSFGAHISLRVAARLGAAGLVTVSIPAAGYLKAEDPPPPGCPWLAVHSRDDDVVPYAQTAAMLAAYVPPARLVTMDGAGHFYHGHLVGLRDVVEPFLSESFG